VPLRWVLLFVGCVAAACGDPIDLGGVPADDGGPLGSETSTGGRDAAPSSSGGGSGSGGGSSSGSIGGSGSGSSSSSGGSGGDAGSCSNGTTMCGAQCVDTQTDPNHCGNCQTTCAGPCNAGHCSGFTSSYAGDVWEADTHIAVGSNGHVAAVWTASNDPTGKTSFVGASISTDSGATWSPVQAIQGPSPSVRSAIPAIAVDAANNVHLAFEDFDSARTESHIYVTSAPAGTTTFGSLSEVTDPAQVTPGDAGVPLYFPNVPAIAVTRDQEMVVTYALGEWKTCNSNSWGNVCVSNLIAARSTDGQTWTRAQVTSNSDGSGPDGGTPDAVNWASVCASGTTGRIWVVYDEFGSATHGLGVFLQYSDDDGATWSAASTIEPPTTNFISFDPPSCAGDGADVWVTYEVHGSDPLATAIAVAQSADGGKTFGAAVNAMDTSTSTLGWNATLALDSAGHLAVEYYGGSADGDPNAGVYYVQSTDKGATWGKATLVLRPVKLVDLSGKLPDGTQWTDGWLGWHIGVSTGGGSLFTTFADNSSGVAHVDFAMVNNP